MCIVSDCASVWMCILFESVWNVHGDVPGFLYYLCYNAYASTIHQLRLGHGYFRSFLIRLPTYNTTECQCSARIQDVKHLLLRCPIYQGERQLQESTERQHCTAFCSHRKVPQHYKTSSS